MLLLVRHGRTTHNASGQVLGRLDVDLDPLGERQAAALGASGLFASATRVVCSPLRRALCTAAALGPPLSVDPRWSELDYGAYDGRPVEEVPELWQHWADDPSWAPAGGESLVAVGERVRRACDDLWAEATEHDVVVVSHVSPIKAAVAWALGVGEDATRHMFVEVASLCRVGSGRYGPVLRSFNETHHRPSA